MIDIPDYEGLYSITKDGQIWSHPKSNKYVKHLKGAWLKKTVDNGYEYVSLHKDKKQKKIAVHRLVCLSFFGHNPIKRHVNHINGNKQDNSIKNLEWCTPRENCQHAWDNGLSSTSEEVKQLSRKKMEQWNNSEEGKKHCSKNGKARRKLTKKQVQEILYRCKIIGLSAYSICREYGVSKPTILKILKGETYKEFQDV